MLYVAISSNCSNALYELKNAYMSDKVTVGLVVNNYLGGVQEDKIRS